MATQLEKLPKTDFDALNYDEKIDYLYFLLQQVDEKVSSKKRK